MKISIPVIFTLFLLLVSLTGCSTPTSVDEVYTQAAETIAVGLTLQAGQTAVAQLTEIAATSMAPTPVIPNPTLPETPAQPTSTPLPPSATPLPPTETQVPPTATPVPPTPTPLPPSATPIPCYWAQFVKDINVADGQAFSPGDEFTKTWRIMNAGSCAWNRSFAVVFISGSQMDSPSEFSLNDIVRPGEITEISVDLRAPSRSGEHNGYWKLRSDTGVIFGIGSGANEAFFVRINVRELGEMVYNFADNFCNAEWRSASGVLPCPGVESSFDPGYIGRSLSPRIESGAIENELSLVVHPNTGDGGQVWGSFPAYRVRAGEHFRAVTGCMYDSYSCSVMFQLNYRADGGPLMNLETWTEIYDGSIAKIDLDLSPLAGKSVELILTVLNNGSSTDDWAFWLLPRIVR